MFPSDSTADHLDRLRIDREKENEVRFSGSKRLGQVMIASSPRSLRRTDGRMRTFPGTVEGRAATAIDGDLGLRRTWSRSTCPKPYSRAIQATHHGLKSPRGTSMPSRASGPQRCLYPHRRAIWGMWTIRVGFVVGLRDADDRVTLRVLDRPPTESGGRGYPRG